MNRHTAHTDTHILSTVWHPKTRKSKVPADVLVQKGTIGD